MQRRGGKIPEIEGLCLQGITTYGIEIGQDGSQYFRVLAEHKHMGLIKQPGGIFGDRPDIDRPLATPTDGVQEISYFFCKRPFKNKFPVIATLYFYGSDILNPNLADCFKK